MTSAGLRAAAALVRAIQLLHRFDSAQAGAIYGATRRHAKPGKTIRLSAWTKWIALQQERFILDTRLHDHDAVALADELAASDLPDPLTAATLRDLLDRAERAAAAQRRQLVAVAGLRGVPLSLVSDRYHQLRRQYLLDLWSLPDDRRPDPPLSWVRGFTGSDHMASSCPADPASLYAIYRLQCDATVLPAPTIGFAATDLETAGPETKEGFTPEGGCIIEVGIAHYTPDGTPTGDLGELVRPCAAADPARGGYGTGAVQVHGITWDDVAQARRWHEVAPDVVDALTGRVLVAHNLRFEQTWLTACLAAYLPQGQARPWALSVDTLSLARQHFPDAPSHKLVDVCAHLGITYDRGHRALHDAMASAGVLFALRRRLACTWSASTRHATTPLPAADVQATVGSPVQRLTAGHPSLSDDPWLCPAGASVS